MAMQKSTKILIGVAGALLLITLAGLFYLAKTFVGPVVAQTREAMDAAHAFAASSDNNGCVTEARTRYKAENEVTAALKESMFLTVCLKESKPSPGFCDGNVP